MNSGNKKTALLIFGLMLCLAASAQSLGAHQDTFDYDMRELRYAVAPDFNYNYGDWIQYIPGAATWALKACGVQSRSSWGQMAVSQAGGALLSWGTVMAGKFGLARMRPDGSRANSFPSGHTTTAFLTATWLQKEYGADMPWLGALGYGVASLTAQQRILRNKHWAEDTMAGAVLGIATAELGYWLGALIFKQGRGYKWHQDFCYDPSLKYWDVYYWFGRKIGLGNDGYGSSVNLQLQAPMTPYWSLAVRGTAEYIRDFYGDDAAYSVMAGANWIFLQRGRFAMDAHALAGAAFRNSRTGMDLTAGLCADFALTGACKVRAMAEWEGMNIFPEELCRPYWMNSLNLGLGGVIFF